MKRVFLSIMIYFSIASSLWAIPPIPPGAGGTPGGSPGQIQYNNNGAFGGTTAITGTSLAVSDYQYIPIDAGMDSKLGPPSAASKVDGQVGSVFYPTTGNVSYTTYTAGSNGNLTNVVWGSGTQTLLMSINTLTAGKLYQVTFTPTVSGQVPAITNYSGIEQSSIPAVVSGTQEVIFFKANSATAILQFANTATSTWSTASTAIYEYSRPAIGRDFSSSAQQTLIFDWMPPVDWNAGTVTYQVMGVIDNTAPTTGQTAIYQLSAFAVGSSDSLSQTPGGEVTSTFTADTTYALYDEWMSTTSGAVTINNAAAGKKVRLILDRLTSGTYAQPMLVTGIMVKYGRTLAP